MDQMQRKERGGFLNKIAIFLSAIIFVTAVGSTALRLKDTKNDNNIKLIAAEFAMPQGNIGAQGFTDATMPDDGENENGEKEDEKVNLNLQETGKNTTDSSAEDEKNKEENSSATDNADKDKKTFPVIESQYGSAGVGYDNFFVKNTTDYVINIGQEINSELGFKMENISEPQVLIVHTHTTEAYTNEDLGYYYEGQEFRTSDDEKNVTQVGQAIVKKLNENGIGAVHAKEHHDDPTYNGSYDRCEQTIYKYLEQYPSIKVIIDIHRDSIGYDDERGKIKPTFVAKGKKAAQIMIMSGYDPNGEYGFSDWEYNLRFALRLQQKAETMYPGMTRPLYFGDFAYNMFINTGSLLIEVGTEVNTLDEAVYSGELLGEVMSSVLKS